jgi:hypothetical protein
MCDGLVQPCSSWETALRSGGTPSRLARAWRAASPSRRIRARRAASASPALRRRAPWRSSPACTKRFAAMTVRMPSFQSCLLCAVLARAPLAARRERRPVPPEKSVAAAPASPPLVPVREARGDAATIPVALSAAVAVRLRESRGVAPPRGVDPDRGVPPTSRPPDEEEEEEEEEEAEEREPGSSVKEPRLPPAAVGEAATSRVRREVEGSPVWEEEEEEEDDDTRRPVPLSGEEESAEPAEPALGRGSTLRERPICPMVTMRVARGAAAGCCCAAGGDPG